MAIYHQQIINSTTKLGIWCIEEDESFFLKEVPLQQTITHPHKRLQHLAGRYLLRYLFHDFPYNDILIADTRKPYLSQEQYHFSISHCGNYAAAIVSSNERVGIDIEKPDVKVTRISHKFIHENELSFLQNSLQNVLQNDVLTTTTVLWSAKEALFKWYGLGNVDFKEHMQLNNAITVAGNEWTLPFVFKKNNEVKVTIQSFLFEHIVLSWLHTPPSSAIQ